eukprot:TRINITY_DN30116_c0_g2_i1.p1 TRINITY_DN30116_c0_g2~~TRINITY_DN30116_c0_g2_i1.p1  ORF type:complete len:450 (-),score=94.45 TRINITY_DN30116_c0_g2_i1:47-1360(-)
MPSHLVRQRSNSVTGEMEFYNSYSSMRFLQTDGWEGYDSEQQEEMLTEPKDPKPWHVPDTFVADLVRTLGQREGIEDGLLQHAKCREPRRKADVEAEDAEELSPDMVTTVKLEATNRLQNRSVRFEGAPPEDAIDKMMRSTLGEGSNEQPEEQRASNDEDEAHDPKSWKVSDEQLERLILKMREEQEAPQPLSNSAPARLTSSVSAPSLSLSHTKATSECQRSLGKRPRLLSSTGRLDLRRDGKIGVNIFFLDSGDTMTVRVDPELHIGPAMLPEGNRFTDIFGLGASTKGFNEVKKFDYKRRKWGAEVRENWLPEWSQSLKGLVEELTGVEVARQRLMYKNVHMTSENMTIKSWGLKDGDTIMLRYLNRVPSDVLETSEKAMQAAQLAARASDRPEQARSASTQSLPPASISSPTGGLAHKLAKSAYIKSIEAVSS